MSTDPHRFGLTTSAMQVCNGSVVVRHGRRTGSDTARILLHGAAGSWSTWTPLLSASDTAGTADAFSLTDLIIPDLPGWGDSPLPADPNTVTIESLAATVGAVARALGYRSWVVVGHSMGGVVALELAGTEPGATLAVGLVSPTTFAVRDSVQHPLTGSAMVPAFAGLLAVLRVLALLRVSGRGLLNVLSRAHLLRAFAAPLFAHPTRIHSSVLEALTREIRPAQFARAAARLGAYDAVGAWERIGCPVEMGVGDADAFVVDHDADRLRACIRTIRVSTLPGTGHFAHLERPAAVLRLLRSVLTDPARADAARAV
ncbi:MAG: alpha/beta hydrolase [Cryobacterium sp.]